LLLNRIAGLGANSVSLVIPIFQDGPTGSAVYADRQKTPSDARITIFASEARRGLTLMLRALLDIGTPQTATDWRGSIHPLDPDQWRQSYSSLMLGYARLAQTDHLAGFDIGSELDSMEPNTAYWQNLVNSTRTVFVGQVTYSSNWAKSYTVFGSSLDFINIDAYFPLNRPVTATAQDLAGAWQPWIDRMARIARSFRKHWC
jgi:glycosyl hydrolase family 113